MECVNCTYALCIEKQTDTHALGDPLNRQSLLVRTRNILLLYIICHYDDYTWGTPSRFTTPDSIVDSVGIGSSSLRVLHTLCPLL